MNILVNTQHNYYNRTNYLESCPVKNFNQYDNNLSFKGASISNIPSNNTLKGLLTRLAGIFERLFVKERIIRPENSIMPSKKIVTAPTTQKEKMIAAFRNQFPNGIEKATPPEIFAALGIKCEKAHDGSLIISGYESRIDIGEGKNSVGVALSELGIDERRLINNVKRIEGFADFSDSQLRIEDLKNIKYIGSILVLLGKNMNTNDIPLLERICGRWIC